MSYVQIDKGHCGGDRTLFAKIGEALTKTGKFKVIEDTMIVTIQEIVEKEVTKEKEEDKNERPATDTRKDNDKDSKDKGTTTKGA